MAIDPEPDPSPPEAPPAPPNPIEQGLGCLGSGLLTPLLLPIGALVMGLARLPSDADGGSSRLRWGQKVLKGAAATLLLPLFLLTLVLAFPYFLVVKLLQGVGLVREVAPETEDEEDEEPGSD
ncbi:MAG TPA: hypothetical protein VF017_01595 [Thermoanaerobaculia bacterium]|nr:hypothetical protein [Thermoanaerobaculia bacterium]